MNSSVILHRQSRDINIIICSFPDFTVGIFEQCLQLIPVLKDFTVGIFEQCLQLIPVLKDLKINIKHIQEKGRGRLESVLGMRVSELYCDKTLGYRLVFEYGLGY